MKKIEIIIEELKNKGAEETYFAYIKLFPSIKTERDTPDECIMDIASDFPNELIFNPELSLSIFPDFEPEQFELDAGVYSEEMLADDDLYKFVYDNMI